MKTFANRTLSILALVCLLGASVSRADTYVFNIDTKQKEKAKSRWSLSEWLDTRDRMRMMDLWLAMHTASPYEFYVSASRRVGNRENDQYYAAWDVGLAAYAYLFGLELQWQTAGGETRWHGLLDLRLLGYYNQATNLTLQTGIKQQSRGPESLWSPVAGMTLTIYLANGFGINGLYRHSFAPIKGNGGEDSDRLEGGAFVEFGFVRIFGEYFKEVEVGKRDQSYSGVQLGTRLYF